MSKTPQKQQNLYDRANSFGWISIALHWLSAILISALWLLGNSISYLEGMEAESRRSLHIATGLSVWALLAGRVIWRLISPHPHVKGQTDLTHRGAKLTHHVMLGLIAVMITSGPVMAWALSEYASVASSALKVHSTAATALLILVILHVLATLKHLMFHDDETISRIFIPRKLE
jgi:cytochrome b561